MAAKVYLWISLWMLLSTPIVLWDAGYCFMRPRSMRGGDLHWIWKPYALYQDIDYIYGLKAFNEGDGFTNAQSFMNLIEVCLNMSYVYLAHVVNWDAASLIGFTGALMTLWKTVLYVAQEYFCSGASCTVGHNDMKTLIFLWVIPNGLWLLFPTLIVWRLGSDIVQSLEVKSRQASVKKQR